jgi:hypothetical protein
MHFGKRLLNAFKIILQNHVSHCMFSSPYHRPTIISGLLSFAVGVDSHESGSFQMFPFFKFNYNLYNFFASKFQNTLLLVPATKSKSLK